MGANRPRYGHAWTDYRGVYETVKEKVEKIESGGYNPNIKRMTCPNHGLEWHRYGQFSKVWKCVKC